MTSPYYNLQPGRTLGRNYFIVEFLGAGWEGEVYKVEERRTGVLRAAKIFYEGRRLSTVQMQRYAKKLNRMKRCNIITQYLHRDVARVGRETVEILVSDLAEGIMLSSFLEQQKRKRLSSFEALHLLHALAVGMEPIHYLGEYHGDIHSDNILVQRVGIGFEVHLLDFFDLGRPTKEKIQNDVIDLVSILHEAIGGQDGYSKTGSEIRQIVNGRKHSLIAKKFKTAGQLRIALENMEW